ncbi:hypothetical protein ACA910_020111 [Epithemia clementina (nom. ined.)]
MAHGRLRSLFMLRSRQLWQPKALTAERPSASSSSSPQDYHPDYNLNELGTIAAVVSVVLLDLCTTYESRTDEPPGDWELINGMSVVDKLMLDHFDYTVRVLSVNALVQILNLFEVTTQALSAWLQAQVMTGLSSLPSDGDDKEERQAPTPSWIRALDRFKNREPIHPVANEQTGAKDEHGKRDSPHTQPTSLINPRVLKDHTAFVSKVISRACYLLSHDSLLVQVASCQVLKVGFSYLGLVATRRQVHAANDEQEEEEVNGAKTAILRHAADSWPAISARFKATWSTLATGSRPNSYVALTRQNLILSSAPQQSVAKSEAGIRYPNNRQNEDSAQCFVLMENLIGLVAVMVMQADDFMADRFRNHVWPVLSDMLRQDSELMTSGDAADKQVVVHRNIGSTVPQQREHHRIAEKRMLRATVDCLSRIYASRLVGRALSDLIPAAAGLLLPLVALDKEEELSNLSTTALKQMVLVDLDAIWRPLRHLCSDNVVGCSTSSVSSVQCTAATRARYQEIMDTILFMPEQELW